MKVKRIIEIEEYHIKELQEYCKGEHYGQLRFEIINSAFSSIAHSIPYDDSGDCISREALKEAIQKCEEEPNYQHDGETWQNGLYMAETLIDNAPTVEITEEQAIDKLHETGWLIEHDKEMTTRPQGKWELHGMIYYCSECGHDCGESGDNFCGNCGADMKGGAE